MARPTMDYDKRIEKARIDLLLNQPFFGRVASHLGWEHSPAMPTAATDGERVIFGHDLLDRCTDEELLFVAAHEVHHVIKKHHFRIKKRNHKKWNYATDFQINDELKQCGFTLPANLGPLLDPKYNSEMLEEEIYNKIPDSKVPENYYGLGEILPSPHAEGSPEAQKSEAALNKAIESATQIARERGMLPGCLGKYTAENKKPQVNWREKLQKFVQPLIARDISWNTPNRRMLHHGWIPGPFKDGIGRIYIAVDTSGSVSDREVSQFMSEMHSICADASPEKTVVYYFTSNIWRKDEFDMCEEFRIPDELERGGTYITPVLEDIEKIGEKPVCLVILSDLYIEEIEEPNYPVIAICTTDQKLPFGETVNVEVL